MAKKAEIVKQDAAIQPYSLQQSIITLRGEQVMLDFQLAKLYGVETRVLKQAVNRNIERFPQDFMFRLTKDECNTLISNEGSQSVIPSGYNEMREELDNIYNAIGALSIKYQAPPKSKNNPIGFAATAARYEEEEKGKKQ